MFEQSLAVLQQASILGDLDARRKLRRIERRLKPQRVQRTAKVPGHRPTRAEWRKSWRSARKRPGYRAGMSAFFYHALRCHGHRAFSDPAHGGWVNPLEGPRMICDTNGVLIHPLSFAWLMALVQGSREGGHILGPSWDERSSPASWTRWDPDDRFSPDPPTPPGYDPWKRRGPRW